MKKILFIAAALTAIGARAQDALGPSAKTIDPVAVYGKSHAQQLRESGFAVSAVQIGDALKNTSADLNHIIGRTTSVRVRQDGGSGSESNLSINGLSGNSVRYFIDGVPLSSLGSDVTPANIPTAIIDRVEIYKGVVPAWLGADALGGAINIITRKTRSNYLDLSYGIGSFHTHKADLNAQLSHRGVIFRPTVAVNYSKNDYMMRGVEVWNEAERRYKEVDRRRFHDDYFSLLGQIEAGVADRRWADAFFVSASYSTIDKELQTGSVQSKVIGAAWRESRAWNVSARYGKRDFLVKNLHLNASVSHTWDRSTTVDTMYRKYDWNGDWIESSRNEITGRAPSVRHFKRPTTIARANLDYEFNRAHSLNANYLLNRVGNDRWDDVDTGFEPSRDVVAKHIVGLSYNQNLFKGRMANAFFVKEYINHLDIRQRDLPTITGSINVTGPQTQWLLGYGAASRFTVVEPFSIKASYEHSTRLPLARELLGNGTTIYANVALEPESSDNVNAGFFGTWHPASGHTLYWEAGGFLRYTDNYIQARVSEKEGMLQYENVAAVHIKGLEGEVRYNWTDRLHLAANASFHHARDQGRFKTDGKPSATYLNRVPNQPWLFGNAEAGYVFQNVGLPESKLRLGITYQWVHWYFLTWEAYGLAASKARIPTQHIVDVSAIYSWALYSIALECTNLFDETAYDNYKLQKPGRSFSAKFTITL